MTQLLIFIYCIYTEHSNGLRQRHPDCKAGNSLQCLPRFKNALSFTSTTAAHPTVYGLFHDAFV